MSVGASNAHCRGAEYESVDEDEVRLLLLHEMHEEQVQFSQRPAQGQFAAAEEDGQREWGAEDGGCALPQVLQHGVRGRPRQLDRALSYNASDRRRCRLCGKGWPIDEGVCCYCLPKIGRARQKSPRNTALRSKYATDPAFREKKKAEARAYRLVHGERIRAERRTPAAKAKRDYYQANRPPEQRRRDAERAQARYRRKSSALKGQRDLLAIEEACQAAHEELNEQRNPTPPQPSQAVSEDLDI